MRWLAWLIECILPFGRILPHQVARGIGGLGGSWWAVLGRRDPALARTHLRRAFPDRSDAWIERTVRACFVHFGRQALVSWKLWSVHGPALLRRIAVANAPALRESLRAARRGDGTVVATGHFGNWELGGRAIDGLLPPGYAGIIAKKFRDERVQSLIERLRLDGTERTMFVQEDGLTPPVRLLKQGGWLALLVDQDIRRFPGCFIPWFGHDAYTPTGLAALALLSRCPVQPIFLLEVRGRYVLHVGPRRRFQRTGDKTADLERITRWVSTYQERLVRRYPAQWVWWHKRWATTPDNLAKHQAKQARQRQAPATATD